MSLKTFAVEALSNLPTTAAIAPSSKYLSRAMLRPLPRRKGLTVVEFGPGTGSITRPMLEAMPADGRLVAFEISPRFSEYLRDSIEDPRFLLVSESAEHLSAALDHLGIGRVDAVVSSLGLTIMPEALRDTIFEQLDGFMDANTVLTQYQYMHGLVLRPQMDFEKLQRFSTECFLHRYFSTVTRALVWRNLPPAVVYTCKR